MLIYRWRDPKAVSGLSTKLGVKSSAAHGSHISSQATPAMTIAMTVRLSQTSGGGTSL